MHLDQSLSSMPQQSLNISANMIASIKILQSSADELEQRIAQELAENPAFEVEELEQCLRCGTPLVKSACPSCGPATRDEQRAEALADLAAWEDDRDARVLDLASGRDEDPFDLLAFVRAGDTLQEHVLLQLTGVIASDDQPIAEYLVGNLDTHGYLTITTAEAAAARELPVERVEQVLAVLLTMDPVGIGARDLRECLLTQLHVLRERGKPYPLAEELVNGYLEALGEHHFLEIGRDLHRTSTQVKQAWYFIRSNLNPFPAHAFEGGEFPGVAAVSSPDLAAVIKPDVVMRRTATGFEAEVMEERRFTLGLNPTYLALSAKRRSALMSEQEYQHVRRYATRARFFIDCVRQRWDTLKRIAEALIVCQFEFLDKGVRYLQPLTRSQLADLLELHESTVSRATANKFALLPTGRTVPFDDFFDSSLVTKDTLRELIEHEDPQRPYSDEDLAALLGERGLSVARRTVAKYRESMRILPSRFRI